MSKILQHSLKFRIANVAASFSSCIQTEVCIDTSRAPPVALISHFGAYVVSRDFPEIVIFMATKVGLKLLDLAL